MTVKIQKEVSLILGYLMLLCGVFFWDLQPFHLLLTLIIEYLALLIVYLFVSIVLSKTIFDKILSTASHLFNGLALGLVQGGLTMLMAYLLEGRTAFDQHVSELPWLVGAITVPMLILQFLALRGKTIDKDLQDVKMGELIFSAITFPAMILCGMLAYEWSDENKNAALIAIVSIRILIEIWNNHFRKNTSKKKSLRSGRI